MKPVALQLSRFFTFELALVASHYPSPYEVRWWNLIKSLHHQQSRYCWLSGMQPIRSYTHKFRPFVSYMGFYLRLMIENGRRNIVDIIGCFHQTWWFSILVSCFPYLWYINYQKVSTKKSDRIGDSSLSQGLEQSHRAACMNRPAFPGWCRWCNFQ